MAIEGSTTAAARIRLGMVGGGGRLHRRVHRIASAHRRPLRAGRRRLSSTPEKAKASGADLGSRRTASMAPLTEMAKREARLKDGIEAVAIVTPEPHALSGGQANS
jgi:predicted dehydrogenase